MSMVIANGNTATLSDNLAREGRIAYFDPLTSSGFSDIVGWVDMGLFPTATTLAPTANKTTTDLKAAPREGGPDITVASSVDSISIVYDINVLSPDPVVRELHTGSPKVVDTTGGDPLLNTEAYAFDPTVSVSGRLILVRKSPLTTGLHRVIFHPRVGLTNNGIGNDQGRDTLQFQATVLPFTYTPGNPFAWAVSRIGQYGVEFHVPKAKLQVLLDDLDTEAAS